MQPEDEDEDSWDEPALTEQQLHRRALLRHLGWLFASLLIGGGLTYSLLKSQEKQAAQPPHAP